MTLLQHAFMVKTITAFICQMRSIINKTRAQMKQMIKYCDSYSYFFTNPTQLRFFSNLFMQTVKQFCS